MIGPRGSLIVHLSILTLLFGCAENREIVKKRAKAREQLGMAYVQEGDLQGGLKELLEAAETNPENADLQHNIAFVYSKLGELDLSIRRFNRALELRPDFPVAQNNLGNAYLRLEQWDSAMELFRKAANNVLYRTRHIAYTNIGYIHHRKGEYRKAIESYKKALGFSRTHGPAYDNMGLAYEMLKEYELAIESYRKAIENTPKIALSHLRLARLYLKLGRNKEAEAEFLETIKNDLKGRFAQEAKRFLKDIKGDE